MWLLGFEPRSPRPQRGILTTKLQPHDMIISFFCIINYLTQGTLFSEIGSRCSASSFKRFQKNFSEKKCKVHEHALFIYRCIYPGVKLIVILYRIILKSKMDVEIKLNVIQRVLISPLYIKHVFINLDKIEKYRKTYIIKYHHY